MKLHALFGWWCLTVPLWVAVALWFEWNATRRQDHGLGPFIVASGVTLTGVVMLGIWLVTR